MNYAVYIALPSGDDAAPIVEAALEVILPGHRFSVRQHGDPLAGKNAELLFRVEDVSLSQEALAGALQIYEAARQAAGLRRDSWAEPSLEPAPRSN